MTLRYRHEGHRYRIRDRIAADVLSRDLRASIRYAVQCGVHRRTIMATAVDAGPRVRQAVRELIELAMA